MPNAHVAAAAIGLPASTNGFSISRRSFVAGASLSVAATVAASPAARGAANAVHEAEQDALEAEMSSLWEALTRKQKAALVQFLQAMKPEPGRGQ